VQLDRHPNDEEEVFKLTEVNASSDSAILKAIKQEEESENYGQIDIASFKERYRLQRVKEKMIEY
jgi:chromosome segregation and condensation protein ScpB